MAGPTEKVGGTAWRREARTRAAETAAYVAVALHTGMRGGDSVRLEVVAGEDGGGHEGRRPQRGSASS
jgi:hypothetical protein